MILGNKWAQRLPSLTSNVSRLSDGNDRTEPLFVVFIFMSVPGDFEGTHQETVGSIGNSGAIDEGSRIKLQAD